MKQDEELEQLLGEIPRATSAPPHLDEPRNSCRPQLVSAPTEDAVKASPDNEQYEGYYRNYSGGQTISEIRVTYTDIPVLSPPMKNGSFCRADQSQNQVQSEKQQFNRQSSQDVPNGTPCAYGSNSPQQTRRQANVDQSLPSAFRKLNLDGDGQAINPGSVQLPKGSPASVNGSANEAVLDGLRNGCNSGMQDACIGHLVQSPLGDCEAFPGVRTANVDGCAAPGFLYYNSQCSQKQQLDAYAAAKLSGLATSSVQLQPYVHADVLANFQENMHHANLMQPQVQNEGDILRHSQFIQQHMLLQQQQQHRQLLQEQVHAQARFFAALQSQPSSIVSRMGSLSRRAPDYQMLQQPSFSGSLQNHQFLKQQQQLQEGLQGFESKADGICRYHMQGFCCKGSTCSFVHSQSASNMRDPGSCLARNNGVTDSFQEENVRVLLSEKMVRRNSRNGVYKKSANGHHLYPNGHYPSEKESSAEEDVVSRHLSIVHQLQQQQQPKYTNLEEVKGHIYTIARDQHGCRFLQRKFDEGVREDAESIFLEISGHIVDLMTDPFGNYLAQKVLEVCDDSQRMQILKVVTIKSQLVTISLNMHGTRAVQKLIETLKSPEQVAMVVSSLKAGIVTLIKDSNGNHVVQRCLLRLGNEDNQFIFDAAVLHCVEIATHRHGCCVLQRCVDSAAGAQRDRLVAEISANALVLSQDPYGNYVVQYILDLGYPWASVEMIARLAGNIPQLAMQKFSSNVVEKCLKLAEDEHRSLILQELIHFPSFGQLLHHEYANYVIQSALSNSKGSLHTSLVEAIRPHVPALRSSPYGKRILSRTNLKK